MKICMIGEGAQAETHMGALRSIGDIEVVTVAGGIESDLRAFASKWEIPHFSLDLATCLHQPGVEAVINTGPSELHAEQTRSSLALGKHVLLEIPMALDLADTQTLVDLERDTGMACMVCHSRRYTAPLLRLKQMIAMGDLHLHHIVCQTYFFRRVNINRFGQPRTWKDDLLWHHGCHAVDMTRWLLEDDEMTVWGQVGPDNPRLGIPMDASVTMKSEKSGAIATFALSFNNHGKIQTPMRFIGEEATYLLIDNVLMDHEGNEIDRGSIEDTVIRQDREFFDSIRSGRVPRTSFANSLTTMRYLHEIQRAIEDSERRS